MGNLNLAVIINSPRDDGDFLLEKLKHPPGHSDEAYDSFVDSDLWDLPSTDLPIQRGGVSSEFAVYVLESCSENTDLKNHDLESAVNRILERLGFGFSDVGEWRFVRYVEEPEFGPDLSVSTCFIAGKLLDTDHGLRDNHKWMSMEACFDCLTDLKPGCDRVGPLVLLGLGDGSMKQRLSTSLPVQEYPPGVMIVPMRSRTLKPFTTTNLVVFAPENGSGKHQGTDFVAYGDALIVDPGCLQKLHVELKKIVDALPRKLIVFVTHHHPDHIDGLSAIQESNPDAILVAHAKTRRRIDGWSGDYTPVSGGENIYVNGERLTVIFAPGHTDGHMALLHNSTRSLVVGDHCVGRGSAFLDIRSGGNMTEYIQSTYRFLKLSPHVVIPMHGRVNIWPKHMLCGYLKNRRNREESIRKAIEDGSHTLFDVVAKVYSSVDRSIWWAASSNVRLHIDNLAVENKLPEGFSIQKFKASCGLRFVTRWSASYISSRVASKISKPSLVMSLLVAVGGYFLLCSFTAGEISRRSFFSKKIFEIQRKRRDFSISFVYPREEEEEACTDPMVLRREMTTAATTTRRERSKTLHNFTLPNLKWGSQRQLKCTKIGSTTSSGSGSGGGYHRLRRRSPPLKFATTSVPIPIPFRFGDGDHRSNMSQQHHRFKSAENGGEGEGISEFRVKIMSDLKTVRDNLTQSLFKKDEIDERRDGESGKEKATEIEISPVKPWNLRKRRAACTEPVYVNQINKRFVAIEDKIANPSPLRGGVVVVEEAAREKFSAKLSKKEIEEDFMAVLGRRPPRRPKKRPRTVQNKLNNLSPGFYLSEVTLDAYKIPEETKV
ncbi:unnamed protein product [Cochlearia groenlandica]